MSRPRTIRQSIVDIGDSARPESAYSFPRTYTVRNARPNDDRLDLDPPADAQHLKPLAGVPVWSLAGSAVRALPGDRVIVVFRDADPTRPTVVGFEALTTGTHPAVAVDATSLHLGGTVLSTDPAALRASDTGGKYLFDPGNIALTLAPALFYLAPGASTYALVALLPAGSTVNGTVPPVAPPPGTAVVLGPGSTKVTVG